VGIDYVEVSGTGNLDQARVFFFFSCSLLFGSNIVAAEGRGNHIVGTAMD
jgi:hypothetical protein